MPYANPESQRAADRAYRRSGKGRAKQNSFKRRWRRTPRGKFAAQRYKARQRGIEFLFTFEQWWEIWKPHFSRRGDKPDQLCMARLGDRGPYAVGNVKIITNAENAIEAGLYRE